MLQRFNFALFSKGPPATKRENHEGEGNDGFSPSTFGASFCAHPRALPFPSWDLSEKHSSQIPRGKVRSLRSGYLTPAVGGERRES